MSQPIVYHGNLLASGSFGVKGQSNNAAFDPIDSDNPVARVIDGSVLLPHTPSGELYAGGALRSVTYQSVVTSNYSPDVLAYFGTHGADAWSFAVLQSSDFSASATTTRLSVATPGPLSGLAIYSLNDSHHNSRFNWMVNWVGLAAWGVSVPNEMWLAKAWTMPRSPEVGVERTRSRQFARLPIPNGQPFVKRYGPALRVTSYESILLSGSEIDAFNAMLTDIEGGEIFPFTDDLGDSYLAELVGPAVVEPDEAGVYAVSLTFREVNPEVFS